VILFLLLLFINQLGYYCIHIFKQYQLKEQVKQELLASLPLFFLEKIDATANKNHLQWEEAGKEFYLNGQLYDVAKIEEQAGRVYLYCINDKKEEQLLTDLSKQIKAGHDAASNNTGKGHEIKLRLPDLVNVSNEFSVTFTEPIVHEYALFNEEIIFSAKDVDIPPPKITYT